MIGTSKQLKDKIKNISGGDGKKASSLIRNFMMERFLERVSCSKYRNHFILKGGMLVASIVGVNMRATMDIDTTVKALPLNETDAQRIIEEICNIRLEDNVEFHITSVKTIMEDFDYPGIRIMLEARLDRMRQPIKIDISTDDVITPKAVEYDYKLMFEERTISVLTYNVETLLSEKMQTILSRGIANTRLRDFYDVYWIINLYREQIDTDMLYKAFCATCEQRSTIFPSNEIENILQLLVNDLHMEEMWIRFKENNFYVGELDWADVKIYVTDAIRFFLLKEC